jgi:lysophospholipase L1-like esterase
MADRVGLDADNDGLPDIPNTAEYVLNQPADSCHGGCSAVVAEFDVVLDADGVELISAGNVSIAINSYQWSLTTTSGEVVLAVESDDPRTGVRLPEGEFDAVLEVAGEDARATTGATIEIRDTLLVALGDSFAGGEGNPERGGDPAVWADTGATDRTQQAVDHEQAHRSSLAAAAQAAIELERRDPRTSVTFIFLAASGASIEEGVLGPPGDVAATDTEGFRSGLQPQLDELEQVLGCSGASCSRTVDALTLSVGGNDVRFSFALGTLIALEPQVLLGAYDNLLDRLLADVAERLVSLPDSFAALADRFDSIGINQVYLNAYPSGGYSLVDDQLILCEEAGGDLVPGLEVDGSELEVLESDVVGPLNRVLQTVAGSHGWTFLDGHLEAFIGHGYCGSDPYDGASYPGNPFPDPIVVPTDPGVRWFRQAGESVEIQGGGGFFEPARLATAGTFHPNELGHRAYARALLDAMSD